MEEQLQTGLLVFLVTISTLTFFVVALPFVISFIRHILEKKSKFQKLSDSSKIRLVRQLKDTSEELSSKQIGAIITVENRDNLDKLRTDGVVLDSQVTSALLIAIFQKNSPIHDGAVIIRNNRIQYAGTYYKITKRSISNHFGSRHRAALGISENSDAVTIVISEEKGTILLCKQQKIEYVTPKNFQEKLVEYLD